MKSKINEAYLLSLSSKLRRGALLYEKQMVVLDEIKAEVEGIILEIEALTKEQQIFHWNDTKTFNDKSNSVNE